MSRIKSSIPHAFAICLDRLIVLLSVLLVLGLLACQQEEQPQPPPRPTIDDYRLGTFEMELNGERLSGDLTSVSCNVNERLDPNADADFGFTTHSVDLYERRRLFFIAQRRVGRYEIDTIRPDAISPRDWPYTEVLYYHSIEYGHGGGVGYAPILSDTIADFIAVDSIIGGVYFGRFQASFVSLVDTRDEVPYAPDTVIIRNGRFAVREYLGE